MIRALEGVKGQRHAPAALYPRDRPGTLCAGDWVGPRAGLDGGKSRPTGIRSPDGPAHRSVAIPTELPGPLEEVSELKYLGIYLDSRFRFERHVDYITGKCTPVIKMLAKSAKLKWGVGHLALKFICSGTHTPWP